MLFSNGRLFGKYEYLLLCLTHTNNLCVDVIPDSKQEYWCDTYPQEWTEWTTEWSTPTHECANQCDQFKYRCKTCDGAPNAICAAKYGSEGRKSLVAEGGMCGREIIEEQDE